MSKPVAISGETIGERIKAFRLASGMTQKELGTRMGVDQSTVRKYESGKLNPKIETVKKIADALDVDMNALYGETKTEARDFDSILISDYLRGSERLAKNPFIDTSSKQTVELMEYFCCLNQEGKCTAVERLRELTEIERYQDSNAMKKLEAIKSQTAGPAADDAATDEPKE